MLGFHSQNVPIIIEEDDMKFAEIKLRTTKQPVKAGHSSGLLHQRMYSPEL